MNELNWNRLFLDNYLSQYFIVASIVLFTFTIKKYVGQLVAKLFYKFLKRFGKKIDDKSFSPIVLKRLELFLFLIIAFSAIDSLNFPKVLNTVIFKTDTKTIANSIEVGILIIVFFSLFLRFIDYMAGVLENNAKLDLAEDNQLIVFFKDFLKIIVIIIGFLTILQFVFHQNISQFLAGLSIVGAAIALSARESLENLIASFIIFFDKPFVTGDLLKVNNITGFVEKIGLRSTRIRTLEKTTVSVPNKQMVDSIVDNLSLRTHRRCEIKLEIESETSSTVLETLLNKCKELLKVDEITDSSVFLSDITPSSLVISIEFFTTPIAIKEYFSVKQTINLKLLQTLEGLSIKIAGNQKEIKLSVNQQ
jgi:MscS family membrane protein